MKILLAIPGRKVELRPHPSPERAGLAWIFVIEQLNLEGAHHRLRLD
jgi:hypothetical protein